MQKQQQKKIKSNNKKYSLKLIKGYKTFFINQISSAIDTYVTPALDYVVSGTSFNDNISNNNVNDKNNYSYTLITSLIQIELQSIDMIKRALIKHVGVSDLHAQMIKSCLIKN